MKYLLLKIVMAISFSGDTFLLQPSEINSFNNDQELWMNHDEQNATLSVFKNNNSSPILTQNAQVGIRPYIHPIMAPDGQGILTEYQPAHHKHQTGVYWGLKMVNGRDFFMNWQDEHWRRVSVKVVKEKGLEVKWQTEYDLLDENGKIVLTETQDWTMSEKNGTYVMDLLWKGQAKTDIVFGKFYVGGLFLRMPWRKDMVGEVVNANDQRNEKAEQQRAIWTDIGLQVDGRDDLAHIAILDHPDNNAFPVPWRVDGELGVGPSRQILGDWHLNQGEIEVVRYRLIVYTGMLKKEVLSQTWKEYICE